MFFLLVFFLRSRDVLLNKRGAHTIKLAALDRSRPDLDVYRHIARRSHSPLSTLSRSWCFEVRPRACVILRVFYGSSDGGGQSRGPGDRSFWTRQGLFRSYDTGLNVGAVSQGV